jgi:universal stress protein E
MALVQEILRSGHDLLMRSHGLGPGDPGRQFGAADMQLLRKCPCPVWIIRPGTGDPAQHQVLAAINASAADAAEQELNATILELALLLRDFEDAHLTLLQAWTAYGESLLKSHMSASELTEFVEAARSEAAGALSAFVKRFEDRLTGVMVELLKGEPGDVIPQFVESHGIDVVVMGTVARTGIAGFVMGNTAEHVLQRLRRGSVVAVKPAGFESPVQ